MSLVIGLTGGIGSGKTLVSDRLQELGASIIDTDEIAHCLTQQNGPVMIDIEHQFGKVAIMPDGSLNRDYIRALVFKDSSQRLKLENILHPRIREQVKIRLSAKTTHYFVLVVPLLFEKQGWKELMDEVLVIDCPEELQVARVMERNKWPEAQVRSIIATQTSRETRLKGASYVIENRGLLPELIQQIDFLHQKLIKKTKKMN
jgi:dephospho-CoA kinase